MIEMFMNVGGKLTFIANVDKEGLEKYTLSEIYIYIIGNVLLII